MARMLTEQKISVRGTDKVQRALCEYDRGVTEGWKKGSWRVEITRLNLRRGRRATVLMRKGKMWIFDEMVHQDDQFAHACYEGDFRRFTGGAEPQVEGLENGIVPDGAQRGHVERGADDRTSAGDMAISALCSAVLIVRGYPCQRGGALFGESAEFRHFGQDDGGGGGSDTGDLVQALGFGFEFGIPGDQLEDRLLALIDLLLEEFAQGAALLLAVAFKVMRAAVGFGDEGFDELPAPHGELAKGLLLGRRRRGGRGLEGSSVFGKDPSVDGVGFGATPFGAGEVADAAGFQKADGNAGSLKGANGQPLVTAGGFANNMHRMLAQKFEHLGKTLFVVREMVALTGQIEGKGSLGNVEASVDSDRVVLTHTCKDSSLPELQAPGTPATVRVRINKHARDQLCDASRSTRRPERIVPARAAVLRLQAQNCPIFKNACKSTRTMDE